MDYGGHDSIFSENVVITFPAKWSQACIGFGTFLRWHGHQVVNNTCIVPRNDEIIIYLDQCNDSHILSAENDYYTPSGQATVLCGYGSDPISFQEFQMKYGLEIGSKLYPNPNDTSDVLCLVRKYLFP